MLERVLPAGSRRRDAAYRAAHPLAARYSAGHTRLSASARHELEVALRAGLFRDRPPGFAATAQGRRDLAEHLDARLQAARRRVVPWIDDARPLRGSSLLEIGCGTGSSTVAFAEQGAEVVAIDVVADDLELARLRCRGHAVKAELVELDAVAVAVALGDRHFDIIVFHASLEHMTHDERLRAMADTWAMLRPGGVWVVVEAPNRLWYFDAHTSLLPFFHWLPDDLAFAYSRESPREGFREQYRDATPVQMKSFLRRGRGVSFHEFELAIGPVDRLDVTASMFEFERHRNPALWAWWRLSAARRYQRHLQRQCPRVPACFFEESLYVALRRA